MPSFSTTLNLNEAKKHSVRYDQPEGDARLRTIYLGKEVFVIASWPNSVKVTVEWEDK